MLRMILHVLALYYFAIYFSNIMPKLDEDSRFFEIDDLLYQDEDLIDGDTPSQLNYSFKLQVLHQFWNAFTGFKWNFVQ